MPRLMGLRSLGGDLWWGWGVDGKGGASEEDFWDHEQSSVVWIHRTRDDGETEAWLVIGRIEELEVSNRERIPLPSSPLLHFLFGSEVCAFFYWIPPFSIPARERESERCFSSARFGTSV